MNLQTAITAACVAIGGISIAASAKAQDVSVCNVMASVAYGADGLRQDGYTQHQAAAVLGGIIGAALSDDPSIPLHARQSLANAVGRWGTAVLHVVYSRPIEPDPLLRRLSPEITGQVVWDLCMEGRL